MNSTHLASLYCTVPATVESTSSQKVCFVLIAIDCIDSVTGIRSGPGSHQLANVHSPRYTRSETKVFMLYLMPFQRRTFLRCSKLLIGFGRPCHSLLVLLWQ